MLPYEHSTKPSVFSSWIQLQERLQDPLDGRQCLQCVEHGMHVFQPHTPLTITHPSPSHTPHHHTPLTIELTLHVSDRV